MAQPKLQLVSFLALCMICNDADLASPPKDLHSQIAAAYGITCPVLHYHGVKMVDPETKKEITEPSKVGQSVLLECVIEDTADSYQQLNFYDVYPESTSICQQDGTWSLETEPICIDIHQQINTFKNVLMRRSKYCSNSSCDHMLRNAQRVGESFDSDYPLLTNLSSVTKASHEFQLILFIPQRRACLSFMNYNVPLDSNGNIKPHLAMVFVNEEDVLPKSKASTRLHRLHYTAFNKSREMLPSNPPQAAIGNIGACVSSVLVLFVTPKVEIEAYPNKNFSFTWKPAPEFISIFDELYEHATCAKEPTIAHASWNCTPKQVCTVKCQSGYKMISFGDNTARSIRADGDYTIRCKQGRWVPAIVKQSLPICKAAKVIAIIDDSSTESQVNSTNSDRSMKTGKTAAEVDVTSESIVTFQVDIMTHQMNKQTDRSLDGNLTVTSSQKGYASTPESVNATRNTSFTQPAVANSTTNFTDDGVLSEEASPSWIALAISVPIVVVVLLILVAALAFHVYRKHRLRHGKYTQCSKSDIHYLTKKFQLV